MPQLAASIDRATHGDDRVDSAFAAAFDRIAADPEVQRAGRALFDKLGSDPQVGAAADSIVHDFTESPEFRHFVQTFQTAHPNDFKAAFARHMTEAADSPGVDAAIGKASDALMRRRKVKQALSAVTGKLLANGTILDAFQGALSRVIERPEVLRRVAARASVAEGDPHFDDVLSKYLGDKGRTQQLLVGFAQLFGTQPAPRRAAVHILRSPELFGAVVKPARAMLADPEFHDRAVRALVAIASGATEPELEEHARRVFGSRALEDATCAWLSSVGDGHTVVSELASAMVDVANSPAFGAIIERVYAGAPRDVARSGRSLARQPT